MLPLATIGRLYVICVGLFFFITGLVGSGIQIWIFTTVPNYRNTPCTFYFIIASIHEFAGFMTTFWPRIIAALMDIDILRPPYLWCKFRYFFLTSFTIIPLYCGCLATIDQYVATSNFVNKYRWSNMRLAYRVSSILCVFWWLHGALWLYYQNVSPVTGICGYISQSFYAYTAFFICFIACGVPMIIMSMFGTLTYRNIKNTAVLARLRIDRQLLIVVFIQILLTLIGIAPYGAYNTYASITNNAVKSTQQKTVEALAASVTFIFASVTYGGRFYLFLYASPRFRHIVRRRIFFCRRRFLRQTAPL